jgi:hypothetical protein
LSKTNPEHKQPEPLLEAKNTKSKGEKTFDRAVYVGMAGVGTFFATLYMAFKLKHGGWAGPRYQRAVEWTQRNLGRFLSPQTSEKVAEEAVMTTALMMGGNAMILPIGAAEHYKVPIVSGLNVMIGDKTPPEAIEQAPKQTWWSLIEGRLVAWGAVFSALMTARFAVPDTFKLFPKEVGQRTHQFVQWLRKEPMLGETAMKKTKAFRYGEIGAFDVFATAAAATILYIGGHFFARKQAEKKSGNVAEGKRHGLPLMRSDAEAEPVIQAGAVTAVTGDKAHHGTLTARAVEQHLS